MSATRQSTGDLVAEHLVARQLSQKLLQQSRGEDCPTCDEYSQSVDSKPSPFGEEAARFQVQLESHARVPDGLDPAAEGAALLRRHVLPREDSLDFLPHVLEVYLQHALRVIILADSCTPLSSALRSPARAFKEAISKTKTIPQGAVLVWLVASGQSMSVGCGRKSAPG